MERDRRINLQNRMMVFIAVLIVIWMAVESVLADTGYIICQPNDYINVRIKPTRKSDAIGHLDCGDSVELYDVEKNGFIKCSGFEDDGWVSKRYIVYEKPQVVNSMAYVVCKGRLAARKWIKGKLRKWLYNGDKIKVYCMTDEWAVTDKGFVQSQYLELEGV